jgi:menaquinone-dependent protoporphyrinogen IX oxidase
MPENFHAGAYEGVIVGAAKMEDEFPMELNRLVRHYRAQFHEMTSGFFTTMAEDASPEQTREENLAFVERTQWYPVEMAAFGSDESRQGAVIQRMDFSATGRRRMGQIDLENDYHSTDAGSVDIFIAQFNEHIEYAREHPDMPLGPAGAR